MKVLRTRFKKASTGKSFNVLKTSYRNQKYGSGGNVLLSINKTTSLITNREFVKKITGALLGVLDLRVLCFGIVFGNFLRQEEKVEG